MDVSLGLSRAVVAAAVLALRKGACGPQGESLYPLAAGRILLQVNLARRSRPQGVDCSGFLAPGYRAPRVPQVRLVSSGRPRRRVALWPDPAPEAASGLLGPGHGLPVGPRVRLLTTAQGPARSVAPALVQGFEPSLVRPTRALVASGLVSFGIAALMGGGGAFGLRTPLAADLGPALRGPQDAARWERQLLLAGIAAPSPHIFRRGRVSSWNSHKNTVLITHANVFKPHSNTALVHTDIDTRPYK